MPPGRIMCPACRRRGAPRVVVPQPEAATNATAWAPQPENPASAESTATPVFTPAAPARRRRLRVWLLVGLAVVVGAAVGLVGGASSSRNTAVNSSGGAAAANTPAPADSTPTTAAPPTTVDPQMAAAQAVKAWINDEGVASINQTVISDMSAVQADAGAYDVASMVTDCDTWRADIARYEAVLPAPDPQLNTDLSNTLADYGQAAADCVAGGTTMDSALVGQAATLMGEANSWMGLAAARLEALSALVNSPGQT